MKFSYNWLKEYIPTLPPPEKVAALLTVHSFEVEGFEKKGADTVFSIDVLPNRIADASGHRGVAGELGAILKKPLKIPNRRPKETARADKKLIRIDVRDKQGCPRYTVRVVTNVRVGDTPQWMQDRLAVCGINSINNIVDTANYVMLDMVQPLHAFDADKIVGGITVRRAKTRENIVTLDGAAYALNEDDLVIADDAGVLAIAGIKGGKRAEVTRDTKNIILESANFTPELIERTAKKINLLTDAAVRFRVGIDSNLTVQAINEAAALIQQIAGGLVVKGILDTGKDKPERTIAFRKEKADSVVGVEIPEKEIITIFKRLGLVATKQKGILKVRTPSIRVDLQTEEDLIEELTRMYGLMNLKPVPPRIAFASAGDSQREKFHMRVEERLTGFGYSEVYSYAFAGDAEIGLLSKKNEILSLLNPLRPEMKYLRPNLTGSLLSALSKNQQLSDVRVFEIGMVFHRPAKLFQDTSELEDEHIALGFFTKEKNESPFFELKGAVMTLAESLGITDVYANDAMNGEEAYVRIHEFFYPFRFAEIRTDTHILGIVGEVHPRVRELFSIKGFVGIAELSFAGLLSAASENVRYKEISKFPSIIRDIALLVPLDTRVAEAEDIIENTGGELLIDTDLIDLYEGAELPDSKKNFAFRLVFQSHDRTLTDEEVNAVVERIIKTLETNLEWEVRK